MMYNSVVHLQHQNGIDVEMVMLNKLAIGIEIY